MKTTLPLLAALLFASHGLQAADSPKTSILDALESPIPPQSVVLGTMKVAPSKDPAHAKVLEFTTDYAHPTESPRFNLPIKKGVIKPEKHSGLRIWVRSDNETQFMVVVGSSFQRKDGKLSVFRAPGFKATAQWQPFDMPFHQMSRGRVIDPLTNQMLSGLDAPDKDDIEGFSSITFESGIGGRGTDGMGHLMLHKLELLLK